MLLLILSLLVAAQLLLVGHVLLMLQPTQRPHPLPVMTLNHMTAVPALADPCWGQETNWAMRRQQAAQVLAALTTEEAPQRARCRKVPWEGLPALWHSLSHRWPQTDMRCTVTASFLCRSPLFS